MKCHLKFKKLKKRESRVWNVDKLKETETCIAVEEKMNGEITVDEEGIYI
jgi:hypothetical protein